MSQCLVDEEWWRSPDASWSIKLRRASQHIAELEQRMRDFTQQRPYEIESESGPGPKQTTYTVRLRRAIPLDFAAIIGDALHNLRSALDCSAFELARRHLGRDLSEQEERDCQFPITETPSQLTSFFAAKSRPRLYGPRDRTAIAGVQPGWQHDQAVRRNVANLGARELPVKLDELWLLHRLSNIDKHRRLHIAGWFANLVYWTSNDSEPMSARWTYGRPPYEDGAVLGRLEIDEPDAALPGEIHHELDLRLVEPPTASNQDVTSLLGRMHDYLANWVLPRVLNPYRLDENGNPIQVGHEGS